MTSILTNTLNRIETWISRHYPYCLQFLQKGLSKGEIDDIAKVFPYSLPPEVYELYQWKNGTTKTDNCWEQAFIFHGMSFAPLEEVAEEYLQSKSLESFQTLPINSLGNLTPYCNLFSKMRIFYDIEERVIGRIWIDKNRNIFPIIFDYTIDEFVIYQKYISLTSMMLTIVDYYENFPSIYQQHLSSYLDKSKNYIWYKYNSDLIELTRECLLYCSLNQFDWNLFLYELVEFKDSININLLIQWLQNLIYANFKDNIESVGFSDEKLYIQYGSDSHDYTLQRSGIPKILGEMGDIRAVPILINALQDNTLFQKNPFSRICTAKALGQLKDKRATVALIKTLKDKWIEARKAAAWALGEIEDSNAVEPLIEALQDDDKEVRNMAKEALSKII